MTILVTGANGQVGKTLTKTLLDNGIFAVTTDKSFLDITKKDDIIRNFKTHKPKLVINTAAYTNIEKAELEKKDAFRVNELGTFNLANACKVEKIPMFHLSTDYVFDGNFEIPYLETDEVNPINIYGKSKLAGEEVIKNILSEHIIFRTSWIFSKYKSNFVKTMLKLGLQNKSVSVINDQIGAPTSATSISHYLMLLVTKYNKEGSLPWGTYHFSQQPFCSWYDFSVEIFHKANEIINYPKVEINAINSIKFKSQAKRPKNSCLDSQKLKSIFNTEAYNYWKDDLVDVIREM